MWKPKSLNLSVHQERLNQASRIRQVPASQIGFSLPSRKLAFAGIEFWGRLGAVNRLSRGLSLRKDDDSYSMATASSPLHLRALIPLDWEDRVFRLSGLLANSIQ